MSLSSYAFDLKDTEVPRLYCKRQSFTLHSRRQDAHLFCVALLILCCYTLRMRSVLAPRRQCNVRDCNLKVKDRLDIFAQGSLSLST